VYECGYVGYSVNLVRFLVTMCVYVFVGGLSFFAQMQILHIFGEEEYSFSSCHLMSIIHYRPVILFHL
jgi:hypothetical protein